MSEKGGEPLSPLSSLLALDLTDEKGFLCGKILADLGVDVIKVEPPGGDTARLMGPPHDDEPHSDQSLYWWAYNANKRSITLNIRSQDGQALFRRLVERADFVVESYQPGYLDGLGLGYASLRELNPRLVFTSLTPFGQEGAYRDYKATDLTLMAMSSFMYLLGEPDGPPVRVTLPQSYLWASAYAALGTLIAHYHRTRTGEGQYVDASAQAGAAWASGFAPYFWDAMQVNPRRAGNQMTGRSHKDPTATYPAAYPCKDGYIAFPLYSGRAGAVSNRALVEWMDEQGMAPPELKEKDWNKFDQFQATQAEYDQITGPISRFFEGITKKDFYREAVRRRIMGYPASTADDILEDPQLEARHFWEHMEHPEQGQQFKFPGPFAKLSLTPLTLRRQAPLIGEHNEEVYVERLGLSREELTALQETGVI